MDKQQSPVGYLYGFAGKKKSLYIVSVLVAVIGVAFSIAPFFIMADIINKLFAGIKDGKMLITECLLMALFWILRAVCHAVSTAISHKATFNVLGNIRKTCLDKLGKISLGDATSRPSGALKNTLVERIDSIETTLAHIVPEFTSNLVGSLGILIYLFVIDWRMALIALIPVPIALTFLMGMMSGYNESNQRVIDATKNLNDSAVEYIGGIEVIKVFGKVKSSYDRFLAAAKEGANCYIDWMRRSNFFFCFAISIMPATLVSVLPLGALFVSQGTLTAENLILIIILAMGLTTPVITCMSYSDDMAKVNTVVGEVTSILDEKDMERPEKDKAEPEDNTVVYKDVHFGYNEKEILHGVNITFKDGTVNALVGPSGSGKSTIGKLLASYWDVNSGSISIGGVDLKDLSLENYHRRVAYVSQDNFLFDDTVRENIRMGNPSATDEEVEQAAKNCGCHDFIMQLENGYDTVVGTSGGHLSGGERQRISIARAILKNAPVIILDEATAYTDPENEAIIQQSVAKLVKNKTLIVIAHRLSTIANADKIVVINNGNVDSEGTHEELLAMNGLYSKMWESHISSRDNLKGVEVNA